MSSSYNIFSIITENLRILAYSIFLLNSSLNIAQLYPHIFRTKVLRWVKMVKAILQKKCQCQRLNLLSYTGQRIYDYLLAMDKDLLHNQLKTALLKDNWLITHDPFEIRISEVVRRQICLGTDNMLAAQRNLEKIAIEIKSFTSDSGIGEFHRALGQYLNYVQALEDKEPDQVLYIAVTSENHNDFFQLSFIQKSIKRHHINLVVYDPMQEAIKQWIS